MEQVTGLDLVITGLIILLFIFWPRLGNIRYYILGFLGLGLLSIMFIFAPAFLIMSPLLYLVLVIFIVLLIYRGVNRQREEKKD